MATRLYFANGAPSISPTADAAWEVTASVSRRILEVEKHAYGSLETFAVATALNSPAGAVDVLLGQFVSAPLSGNQTISGAILGQARALEGSATQDARIQTVIRVLSGDGTTVRGTLIAASGAALSNEFNTALRNIKIPLGGSTVPTSVNALDGDRIVVEIGWRKHESATTNRTASVQFGNPTGTDLAVDETTLTANTPWIEFTDNLVFATASTRASQIVVQPAITPPTVETRASQIVAQPAIVPPTVETRASQIVVQVAVLLAGSVPGSSAQPRSWGYILE